MNFCVVYVDPLAIVDVEFDRIDTQYARVKDIERQKLYALEVKSERFSAILFKMKKFGWDSSRAAILDTESRRPERHKSVVFKMFAERLKIKSKMVYEEVV